MKIATSSRRDFLRIASAAGIATLPRGARILGANGRLNVGVIGLGTRGSGLLEMVLARTREQKDVEVVAVCDVYQKRLSEAAEKAKGARQHLYHQELLDRSDIDAVFIATPDHWHAPISLLAMEKGKDVYCEKPMTHTVEEAGRVTRMVRERQRVFQVGVQAMSWARWHKVREVVQAGTLGKIVCCQATYSRNNPDGDWNWRIDAQAGPDGRGDHRIEWKQWLGSAPQRPFDADRFFRFRKYWDYSGGIATDLHYHIVAPFHLAVENEHPVRVVGMGGLWVYNDGREVPDTFLNAADYPGKWSLTIQSSQLNEHGPATLLRGTKATMILGDEWEGPRSRQRDFAEILPEQPYIGEFRQKWGGERLVLPGFGNEGDRKHVDNFLECVRTRRRPNCDADVGYKVMTNIGLSVKSYREGKMFYFDPEREQVRETPR